ncbi:hypothetical protein EDC02_5664 [Micromonospora sp. Llam0]|nr:hypothetical protein EDC02_5664 [Micromonospora sp. Llam0]
MATYDEYLAAVARLLTERHRPVWSWLHMKRRCLCGSALPCSYLHRVALSREQWTKRGNDRSSRECEG